MLSIKVNGRRRRRKKEEIVCSAAECRAGGSLRQDGEGVELFHSLHPGISLPAPLHLTRVCVAVKLHLLLWCTCIKVLKHNPPANGGLVYPTRSGSTETADLINRPSI